MLPLQLDWVFPHTIWAFPIFIYPSADPSTIDTVVVLSVELELVDDSSLSAQETTARHKHEIRIRKMKITFFIVYSIKNYKERVLKSNRFRLFNQWDFCVQLSNQILNIWGFIQSAEYKCIKVTKCILQEHGDFTWKFWERELFWW